MKKVKYLSLLMALLTFLGCFVACGGGNETEAPVVETESETEALVETKNLLCIHLQ